jgi:DNA polymerase-3 subunit alpha
MTNAYLVFADANTTAVFQFESVGMKKMLKEARPSKFEEIIAFVSLYRPGPMDLIPDFIHRMHGGEFEYLHPLLEGVLEPTYGIMVYQEQVMQAAQFCAGYTLGGADLLRRAMGKRNLKKWSNSAKSLLKVLQKRY